MRRYGSTIAKVLQLMEIIASQSDRVTASELSELTGIGIDTVTRHLRQLAEADYVRASGRGYVIGLGVLPLAYSAANASYVRRAAMRSLQNLSGATGLNASVGAHRRGQLVYLGRIEGSNWRSLRHNVGRLAPLHCTAMGKVLLAHNEEWMNALPERLQRYTEDTITEKTKLLAEIAQVAEQGYATDNKEWLADIRCVAAPVRDASGAVAAAISVSGPSAHVDFTAGELIMAVRRAAYEIQAHLGFEA